MSHLAWIVLTCTSFFVSSLMASPFAYNMSWFINYMVTLVVMAWGVLNVETCDQELPLHFCHK